MAGPGNVIAGICKLHVRPFQGSLSGLFYINSRHRDRGRKGTPKVTRLTTAPEACSVNKHVMARGSFLCARAFSAHEGCVFMSNMARQLQWCLAMSPTWTNYCHSNEFHSKLTWIFLDSLPVWRLFHFTFAFKFFAFCCPSVCCFCFELGGAHSSCHSFAQSCEMKTG